jgi:hypothetical protein
VEAADVRASFSLTASSTQKKKWKNKERSAVEEGAYSVDKNEELLASLRVTMHSMRALATRQSRALDITLYKAFSSASLPQYSLGDVPLQKGGTLRDGTLLFPLQPSDIRSLSCSKNCVSDLRDAECGQVQRDCLPVLVGF